MKKCPFCAEEIQDEAIICRYCGRELEPQLLKEDGKKCPKCGGELMNISAQYFSCAECNGVYQITQSKVPKPSPNYIERRLMGCAVILVVGAVVGVVGWVLGIKDEDALWAITIVASIIVALFVYRN